MALQPGRWVIISHKNPSLFYRTKRISNFAAYSHLPFWPLAINGQVIRILSSGIEQLPHEQGEDQRVTLEAWVEKRREGPTCCLPFISPSHADFYQDDHFLSRHLCDWRRSNNFRALSCGGFFASAFVVCAEIQGDSRSHLSKEKLGSYRKSFIVCHWRWKKEALICSDKIWNHKKWRSVSHVHDLDSLK